MSYLPVLFGWAKNNFFLRLFYRLNGRKLDISNRTASICFKWDHSWFKRPIQWFVISCQRLACYKVLKYVKILTIFGLTKLSFTQPWDVIFEWIFFCWLQGEPGHLCIAFSKAKSTWKGVKRWKYRRYPFSYICQSTLVLFASQLCGSGQICLHHTSQSELAGI